MIGTLLRIKLPFIISGTYAFNHYTGLNREGGDIDIAVPQEDYPNVLKTLTKSGYKPKLADSESIWLAKEYDENESYTDLIFGGINFHFSPIREALHGELQELYPFLGSTRLEEVIDRYNVDAVFHGHSHFGYPKGKTDRTVSVYNCAYPLMQKSKPHEPYTLVEL